MKKKILALSAALLGVGVLAFLLVRADRIIQRQQQALKELSAKVERLEHDSASAVDSGSAKDSLVAEVDGLRRSVTNLQAQLAEVQKSSRMDLFGRVIQNSGDFKNKTLKVVPNGNIVPFSQAPSEVPPDWVPFEFNGRTYYRVPLALAK
jgi:hypothetical protein